MSTFTYVGRNRQSAVKKGELTAKTRDEAVDQLRKQQVVVTSLEEKSGAENQAEPRRRPHRQGSRGVHARQFGTMINAGLPLINVSTFCPPNLKIKCCRNGRRREEQRRGRLHILRRLKRHPKVFDDLYVNMIHAGGVGGLLDTILTRLAIHRKGHETEGPDQVGDGLSHGNRRCSGRHHQRVDGLGHSGVRADVHGNVGGKVGLPARRRLSSMSAISSRAIGTPCSAPSQAPSSRSNATTPRSMDAW